MKTKRGFTLLELSITIVLLVAIAAIVATCQQDDGDSSEAPFFESFEGERNRMLRRQAEAMERQNELLERSLNQNQGAERK
jgi:prepilin-type N-terminal cleavage/methylation domain-containing protein